MYPKVFGVGVGAGDFAELLVVKVARPSMPLRKNLIGDRMGGQQEMWLRHA